MMFGAHRALSRAARTAFGVVTCGGGAAAYCSANVEATASADDVFGFQPLEATPLELLKRFDRVERCSAEECDAAVASAAFGKLVGKTWRLVENENGEEKFLLDGEGLVKRKVMMKLPLTINYAMDGAARALHSDICAAKFLHVVEDWELCGPVKVVVAKGQTVRQQYGITKDGHRPFIRKSELSAHNVTSESMLCYELGDDGTTLDMVTWAVYPEHDPPRLCKYTMHMVDDAAPKRAAAATPPGSGGSGSQSDG